MALFGGCRVLDLTDERGLVAGRLLADLGADVVILEPPGGSTARRVPPLVAGSGSAYWEAFAAGRRGVEADLESDAGRRLTRDLAARSDIVLTSSPPATLRRWGLDARSLLAADPGLVHVHVSAFGADGPKADYQDSDLVVWAAGGALDPHRDEDRPPVRISSAQAFLHAGADAAGGALLAHLYRVRTGRGQAVEVSAQVSLGLATIGVALSHAAGDFAVSMWQSTSRRRVDLSGSGSATSPRRKKWVCRDGMVEMHLGMGPASGKFANALVGWLHAEGVVGDDAVALDWREIPRLLAEGAIDDADVEAVRDAVAAGIATRTKAQIAEAAVTHRVLAAGICDLSDIVGSPQLAARGFWADLGAGERRVRVPGPIAAMGDDAFRHDRPAPLCGEHTAEVVDEWLSGPPRGRREPVAPGWGAADSAAADPWRTVAPPGRVASDGALAGLRVLDLSWVVAGPMIGRALADCGATVVRVESGGRIETARAMGPYYDGLEGVERSVVYGNGNAGKLGVSLDLGRAEGREVVRALAAQADVVIESYSPGTMEKWGLGYDALREHNPDLIMLSTSIAGHTGPLARTAGYGNIGASLAGFMHLTGWPDLPPLGPFGPYTDFVGPRLSLVALLAALDDRRRTGRGRYVDVSQVEAGVWFLSAELAAHDRTGVVPQRRGNRDEGMAPHGVYPCLPEDDEDRYVAVAVRDDREWAALVRLMGRPDLACPRLRDLPGRIAHLEELDTAVAAWTGCRTAEEAERALQDVGIAAHVSASSRDLARDPQLAHLGHHVRLPHPELGEVVVEGPRWRFSDSPAVVRRAAPVLGQDTDDVLRTLLGLAPERIAELRDSGVLR
ncbi:CoA transferase [Pseudonocardia zijingensis]|uniref:CoA transferase n=1 Tax=Pseudonocardia zijingensis TaxID=153376 RepID=A0ABN1Q0Q1_9PSEU